MFFLQFYMKINDILIVIVNLESVTCTHIILLRMSSTWTEGTIKLDYEKLEYWFYEILWHNIVKEHLLFQKRVSKLRLGVNFSNKHKKTFQT